MDPNLNWNPPDGTQASALLVLLFVFVVAYGVAIGYMFGLRGRVRAGVICALSLLGLCMASPSWVQGVFYAAGAVAAFGLFAALSMLLSRALGVGRQRSGDRPVEVRVTPVDEQPLPGRVAGA